VLICTRTPTVLSAQRVSRLEQTGPCAILQTSAPGKSRTVGSPVYKVSRFEICDAHRDGVC
jgi:hypothetical protein